MNFSKKNHKLVGQNEQVVKTSKHDANLRKNSTLYFQVGLILTLLATYALFEMQFESKNYVLDSNPSMEEELLTFNDVPIYKIYEEQAPEQAPKKKEPVIFKDPKIIDDDVEQKIFKDIQTSPPTSNDPPINIEDLNPYMPEEDVDPIPFISIENPPVYPGCEKYKSREDLKKCMSNKISKLVNRKFNTGIAEDLGLQGKQRISVQFKINKEGRVTEIMARAPHAKLEHEAKRIIGKIPNMKPGKQRDKNVEVIYNLPILFKVQQ